MEELVDPLRRALTELHDAGALVLPHESTVLASRMGKVWSGRKANGELWTLTKVSQREFTSKF